MSPDDDMLARLRTALDELTEGTEPATTKVAPMVPHRRRWMLPAVAAAAAVLVGGAAIVVLASRGGGDGQPVAPTPSGPPVTPVAPAFLPWYELNLPGATPTGPASSQTSYQRAQAWAANDYSRVLTAIVATVPDASTTPTDWPIATPIDGVTGTAWAVAYDDGDETDTWRGVYWAPDDTTAVILSSSGMSQDDLAVLVGELEISPGHEGPVVASPLSSLAPVQDPTAFALQVTQSYLLDGAADPDAEWAWVTSVSGKATALASAVGYGAPLQPTSTPFADGFAAVTGDVTAVWWPIDGGPSWAGVRAPTERIEEVLAAVHRAPDIEVTPAEPPGSTPPTTSSASSPSQPTDPPTNPVTSDLTTPPSVATSVSDPTNPPQSVDPPDGTVASTPPGPLSPLAIGDSVMMTAAPLLAAEGVTVDAVVNRQATSVAEALEQLHDADLLSDAVVIQTGTNGTIGQDDMDRMMAAVADVPQVVVLSVHADRSWIGPNNDLIRSLPATYPNVQILDWDLVAQQCAPDCLMSDGVHVTASGAQIYADAITAALASN